MSDFGKTIDMEITLRTKLAWALGGYLERLGYTLTHLLTPNPVALPAPSVRGSFQPDLIAKSSSDKIALGIAIDYKGIDEAETREKLIDFACRFDRRTKLPIELYIGVPDKDKIVSDIKNFFREQQFDRKKTNIRIIRLTISVPETRTLEDKQNESVFQSQ